MNEKADTGCCPRFDPAPWDDKQITWRDKLFVKDRVRSVFHVPLNFGRVMKKNMESIEAAGALDAEHVMLSDENSLWGADVYIAVSKEVPGAQMDRISGTFFTKAFEGPYSRVKHWGKEVTALLEKRGSPPKRLYFWYTTCPRCAKTYGKNYVVVVAEEASA